MEYTVKQVSERTHLTVSTLRYYDKEGLTPQIKRSDSGIRKYNDEDFCWIELICCLKTSGMSIDEIRQFMNLCLKGENGCEERKEILVKHKEHILQQIASLKCSLDIIDYKLDHYKEIGIFHIDR